MEKFILGISIAIILITALLVIVVLLMRASVKNLNMQIGQNQQSAEIKRNLQFQQQSEHMAHQNEQMARQNEKIENLEQKLSQTMGQVNSSIEKMQNLTAGVDDLKRLMSNVKSRGIIGEIQLGAILDDILTPEQYDENVAVKGGSERVEYAVRFPSEDGKSVYLPIDSKFPGDAYMNLLDAYDTGDKELVKKACDNLKYAVVKAAKDIRNKYIFPPYTTDFAIMFLPFEGLYAEVLRLNIVEALQREYRVNVAGPTTMAAILNSFQMGFKSLALQESSGEVWDTLAKAKTEFDKFAEVLEKTQNKLDQTQKELENLIGVRTRGIQRALNNVTVSEKE